MQREHVNWQMEGSASLPKNVKRDAIKRVHKMNATFTLLGEAILEPPLMEMMAMKRREKPAVLPPDYEQALFPDFAG